MFFVRLFCPRIATIIAEHGTNERSPRLLVRKSVFGILF
jgi:hypothetical protein